MIMKKITNIIVAILISILPVISFGQSTVPAPPGHGESGDQTDGNGGGAPIGGGVVMLLTMGAAYGGKKYYDYRRKMQNEMEE